LLEKDVTLAFARRLREELNTRAISATLARDGDLSTTLDQRAAMANSRPFALYICVHASSQGSGLRLFTAMLPSGANNRAPFMSWDTAQFASLPRSRWVQEQLAAAIQKTGFPVRALIAPLRPLNNVTVAALGIEIGPTTSDVTQVASTAYQSMICAALANAIAPLVPQLRAKTGLP
jgi:N-acetylmuramoyl-L-alanine amidase